MDNLSTGRLENIESFKDKVTLLNDLSKKGKWKSYFKKLLCISYSILG